MNRSVARRLTRRRFLGTGVAGTLGLALSPAFQNLLADTAPPRRAKACILLWLNGGPSHIDTFDPKPDAPTNGPFQAMKTKVPGLSLCEHLPKLAEQARHLAVVRSLTSREADHDRAVQYLHTGNQRDETVEHPSLGAVVAREWSAEDGDLPSFVSINGSSFGPGFFGVEYAPHVIDNLDTPVANATLPEGVDDQRMDRRLRALAAFNGSFARRADHDSVHEHERFTAKADRFRKSPALKAFDLSGEKAETLAAYGATVPEGEATPAMFGRACVLARRLIEQGVRFVEVTLDGWDTHADNFNQVGALCKQLDPAFAALLGDLSARGLLDRTLVLCMGEFGRTPVINPQTGRDHWSEVFSAVLAGGGVKGGQVIGASDAKGEQVKDRPVAVPDLYATLMSIFGLDPAKLYRSPGGRPIRLADKGKVVRELLS
jgi:uncharacterized protein (DUF1501 family)